MPERAEKRRATLSAAISFVSSDFLAKHYIGIVCIMAVVLVACACHRIGRSLRAAHYQHGSCSIIGDPLKNKKRAAGGMRILRFGIVPSCD